MTKYVQMNRALGISNEKDREIAEGVLDALARTGAVDEGAKELAEKYGAESLLAGMHLHKLISKNQVMHKAMNKTIRRQNPRVN